MGKSGKKPAQENSRYMNEMYNKLAEDISEMQNRKISLREGLPLHKLGGQLTNLVQTLLNMVKLLAKWVEWEKKLM